MAEFKEQFLRLWNSFSKQQKIFSVAGMAAVFAVVLGWSYWFGGRAEYAPLYTKLEAKDAGDIVNKLKEDKIAYEIADNGSSVLVPKNEVYQVRMNLASAGLPRGKKGFELFEESKFGTTEFQNKVNYLQAVQGELARTIEQIQEIEAARVHIVLPEDSLYKKNEKPASASVMLQLKGNAALGKPQVEGIVNLVSHSVQGLKPENITIIDGFAKILNLPEDEELNKAAAERDNNANANAEANKLSKFYFSLTREIQAEMQENVQTLLDNSLGEKRAVARVTVELNFDRRLIDRQIFEPTVEDRGILRSMQEVSENYQGSNAQPGGPPGTTSNIPGYPAGAQPGQSNYEKKEATRNYEITETKEKIIQQPVSIKRVTVAVFIDEALTQAQQDGIARVVASAAGFNEARGDLVSVERIPFNAATATQIQLQETERQIMGYALYGAPVLLLLLLLLGWMLYSRRKKQKAAALAAEAERERVAAQEREAAARTAMEQERLAAQPMAMRAERGEGGMEDAAESADGEEEELVLTMDKPLTQEEKEIAAKKAAIVEWASTQPDEFAATLRSWLMEET
ncbi:MAG: flagellar M-ring protein FliF [Acidaminococcales bacterium]|jgi:flagellar M-ring protein FliF|nr:flagellar M-ring protein FliF [Acidaminococcales bacterium]